MPINDWIKTVPALVGAIFGVYKWLQAKKMEMIIRQNTWSSYRDMSVIFGGLQRLQQKVPNNTELAQLMGQTEQMMNCQIRQINMHEQITSEKISKWQKAGRICDSSHVDVFNKFADK